MRRRRFADGCLAVLAVGLVACQAVAAEQPATPVQTHERLLGLINKSRSSGPASLTSDEMVELYSAEQSLDPSGIGYFDELMWWWAAQSGLDEVAAASKLTTSFEQKLGAAPAGFRERLVLALNGLPATGRTVYLPPAYVVSGPAYRVRPVLVPGKSRFGITEKDGISRRSIFQPVP
ncbi:MAG: hypothetical protein L0211_06195 [Planctomycetaceae bacterium]|nr:hypothetical protein [Planctomycetaceae bacterium]